MDTEKIKGSQDDRIKELLSSTKVKASQNLKYRIMHQIETEAILARKVISAKKSRELSMPSLFSVLGIAYLIVLLLGACAYFLGGIEAVKSPTSLSIAGLIIVIGSVYWMISYLDARLEVKSRMKK